jgi:hypothetical protein
MIGTMIYPRRPTEDCTTWGSVGENGTLRGCSIPNQRKLEETALKIRHLKDIERIIQNTSKVFIGSKMSDSTLYNMQHAINTQIRQIEVSPFEQRLPNVKLSSNEYGVLMGFDDNTSGYTVEHDSDAFLFRVVSPQEQALRKIKSNLTIIIRSRAVYMQFTEPERRAVETLREMISETDFRRFIKYGFICVKGSSGKLYQIPRDYAHIKVWDNGQMIEEICVRIQDNTVPLTDKLIAFKVMIETNEEDFRKLGNIYKMKVAIAA